MVGNKNSGRKKDPVSDYIRMGKKTLYIRQTQSSDTGKSQVREFMRLDVEHYKRESFWRCKCPNNGLLGNYIPNRLPKCHICGSWKNKIVQLQHGNR